MGVKHDEQIEKLGLDLKTLQCSSNTLRPDMQAATVNGPPVMRKKVYERLDDPKYARNPNFERRRNHAALARYISNHVSTIDLYTIACLLYTSPSPRDQRGSRMPSSA